MIDLRNFEILKEHEIRNPRVLRGGFLRGQKYWIAFRDQQGGNIGLGAICAKLLKQGGSQDQWSRYPKGWELFETGYGTHRFCFSRMAIRAPELYVPALYAIPPAAAAPPKPAIGLEWRPAVILRTPRDTYRAGILEEEERRFRAGCELRRLVLKEVNVADTLCAAVNLLGATQANLVNDAREAVDLFETQILRVDTRKIGELVEAVRAQSSAQIGRVDKAA